MRYVVAGYVIILTILFLYGVQLAWRRRRLTALAGRVESMATPGDGPAGPDPAPPGR
jgi:hypothetical protein